MNHYYMERHAKDTHQKLRQEARNHRLARQAGNGQKGPSRFISAGKVAAAVSALATAAAAIIALLKPM